MAELLTLPSERVQVANITYQYLLKQIFYFCQKPHPLVGLTLALKILQFFQMAKSIKTQNTLKNLRLSLPKSNALCQDELKVAQIGINNVSKLLGFTKVLLIQETITCIKSLPRLSKTTTPSVLRICKLKTCLKITNWLNQLPMCPGPNSAQCLSIKLSGTASPSNQ